MISVQYILIITLFQPAYSKRIFYDFISKLVLWKMLYNTERSANFISHNSMIFSVLYNIFSALYQNTQSVFCSEVLSVIKYALRTKHEVFIISSIMIFTIHTVHKLYVHQFYASNYPCVNMAFTNM